MWEELVCFQLYSKRFSFSCRDFPSQQKTNILFWTWLQIKWFVYYNWINIIENINLNNFLSSQSTFCIIQFTSGLCLIISINLLVVYRESVNLIGYITRRLSADSQQLWIANWKSFSYLFWPITKLSILNCVSRILNCISRSFSAHRTQCLKPWIWIADVNTIKHFQPFKCYFTFLCNETIVNLY